MQREKKIKLTDHGCIISLGIIQKITTQNKEFYRQLSLRRNNKIYSNYLLEKKICKLCTLESVARYFEQYTWEKVR